MESPAHRWFDWRYTPWVCVTLLATCLLWAALRHGTTADPVVVFVAGQRLVYQIEFSGASDYDFGAVFAAGPSTLRHAFETTIEAELTVTVLAVGPEHTSLTYHLRPTDVQFSTDGHDSPDQARTLKEDLARPVFAMLDARGRVRSVRFDPATGSMAQHMTRMLLAAVQYVGPAPGATPRTDWQAEEDDPGGTLVARYQVQADGTVKKTKVRHSEPKQARKRKVVVLSPSTQSEGEYVATIDAGSLVGLSVAETQLMTIQGKRIGSGDLKLEMSLVRREDAMPGELIALGAAEAEQAPAVGLYVAVSPQANRLAIQRKQLGDATLQSLLDDLAKTEAAPQQETDVSRLFFQFKALAIVQPDTCVRLGELLIRADAASRRMRILTDALAGAGHTEAQTALCAAVVARPDDQPALALLIPALGTAEAPTLQAEQTLQGLAFGKHDHKIASAAQLALGNLALSLGDESPDRAAKIVQRFLQELAAPTAGHSTWHLLLALGNAGSTDALPALTRYLEDPNPELRGAAAWALRWIDAAQVDSLLTAKILLTDPDAAVRLEAVRALRFRDKTPANLVAQEQALATDTDASVRLALLGSLWDARENDARVRPLVEQAAERDASPEVRAAAAKLLENGSFK